MADKPAGRLLTAHYSRASRAAMTLLELLMVMCLMAIVLAVSIPAFNAMGRGSDMRSSVSAVRNTISQSRQWAITHRERVSFCYDAKNYFVTNISGQYIQASNSLPRAVSFAHSGSISTLTFKTDGSLASGAITVIVSLVGSSGPPREIHINGLTGGIKVQ
jgi:Tfp pilus assembly protein FimT